MFPRGQTPAPLVSLSWAVYTQVSLLSMADRTPFCCVYVQTVYIYMLRVADSAEAAE
jgi:hypothetical protein